MFQLPPESFQLPPESIRHQMSVQMKESSLVKKFPPPSFWHAFILLPSFVTVYSLRDYSKEGSNYLKDKYTL